MAPYIELHTGPGRGYPVTQVLERGDTLRVFKRKTDWYKIETRKGFTGWVSREDLSGSKTEDEIIADFSKPTRKEFDKRKWEVGVAGGSFSGADETTIYLGYHLTKNISTELKYTEAFGAFSNIKLGSLNIVHQPWPQWRLSPFFIMGSGTMYTSPNSGLVATEDRQDSVLTVGGGLFLYATRNFMLRTEYNSHTVLTARADNEEVHEWKVGFSVFF